MTDEIQHDDHSEEQTAEAPASGEESLEEKVAELEDRLLRTAAEFENYRKRLGREQEEWLRFRHEPLVRDLLPVLDALERAIRSSEGTRDYQAFHDGVELIFQQLCEVMARAGVARDEPVGEPFDPHRHEAVATVPDAEVPADHVATVLEPGYHLHDRVVRPAKVVVSIGREDDDVEEEKKANAG